MYIEHGWLELKVVACVFYNAKMDSVSLHHGDEFVTEAEPKDMEEVDDMIANRFKTKKGPT